MTTMATIIPFPCLSKNDDLFDEQSDAQISTANDFETLIDELQGNLALIRANFLMVQKSLDLIAVAQKDAQTY